MSTNNQSTTPLPESGPRACSHLWQGGADADMRCISCGERRADARNQIVTLQERIAHTEKARDNAITLCDEANRRSREKGQRAAEEIARLKQENERLREENERLRERESEMHHARVAEQLRRLTDIIEKR